MLQFFTLRSPKYGPVQSLTVLTMSCRIFDVDLTNVSSTLQIVKSINILKYKVLLITFTHHVVLFNNGNYVCFDGEYVSTYFAGTAIELEVNSSGNCFVFHVFLLPIMTFIILRQYYFTRIFLYFIVIMLLT